MIQIASTVASVASQSLVQDKAKHLVAMGAASVATVSETISDSESMFAYGNEAVIVVSVIASAFVIYKTWLEVKILRIELATKDRRKNR